MEAKQKFEHTRKCEGQDLEADGHIAHELCTASNQDQAAYWKLFK